jgi:hypothetical protein
MKTIVTAVAVCFVVAAGTAAFQSQQTTPPPPPTQQQQTPPTTPAQPKTPAIPEVSLTGCLIQGSAPTVFILENAKADAKSPTEKGVKYIVLAAAQDLNLRAHLNHEVVVGGMTDGKDAPPTDKKVEEKDLPKLSAKKVTMVSNTCASTVR